MPRRTSLRVATACAFVAVGLLASALVRRGHGGAPATRGPEREAFLETRRERMRAARAALHDTLEDGAQ